MDREKNLVLLQDRLMVLLRQIRQTEEEASEINNIIPQGYIHRTIHFLEQVNEMLATKG